MTQRQITFEKLFIAVNTLDICSKLAIIQATQNDRVHLENRYGCSESIIRVTLT